MSRVDNKVESTDSASFKRLLHRVCPVLRPDLDSSGFDLQLTQINILAVIKMAGRGLTRAALSPTLGPKRSQ